MSAPARKAFTAEQEGRALEIVGTAVANRRAAGLSQTDVAELLGWSQPQVSRVETSPLQVRFVTVWSYLGAVAALTKTPLHIHPM